MDDFLNRLLYPSNLKRFLFFFLFDILIIAVSLYLSFLVRFDFALANEYRRLIAVVLPLFIINKLVCLGLFRAYRITWRYVGINELFNIISALIVAECILMVLILVPSPLNYFTLMERLSIAISTGFPRSIFLIDWTISVLLLSGLRVSKRIFLEIIAKNRLIKPGKKTIIVGAGNTGEMILRDMARQGFSDFYPVGMLDDDKRKTGTYVHGVRVYGTTDQLSRSVQKYGIEAVIIAIPSLNYRTLRRIYESAKALKVATIKIVPRIYDFHKPDINLKNLEDINIEDLIGRQTVDINYGEIEGFLKDRIILVTGAGGSIGSEITMQVCSFNPKKIILFDIDETELHDMDFKLKRRFPYLYESGGERVFSIVGDIRDKGRIDTIFERFNPQIVFHAAAYKHVPIMESNPNEAVTTNMFGTYMVAKASVQYGVEKFIMISTDKAVRPTSIMGATKRMAEHICKAFDNDSSPACQPASVPSATEFISVRFGNVLGSRGSVLPIFLEQLKHGGPLTVTHKEMQRYFMTIPEAVSLVLQASIIGKRGEVLVLDMGMPVNILTLAEELIRLHGLEPYKDIDIEFTGMRPGEKLFEEILTAEEGTVASKHEKIFIAKNSEKYSMEEIEKILEESSILIKESSFGEEGKIKSLLKKYVKHFDIHQI